MPNGAEPISSTITFDPDFTQNVINATGPKAGPRLREIMPSLIRHIHDFAREVNLTMDEWLQGVEVINAAGKMSTDRRNEGQLLMDVIGLETWVTVALEKSSFFFCIAHCDI